ncbi:SMI1/KNR4 family protein [Kitasatospora sp. NBC_00070]|uniref:SMI1/KNR4 family protein n=1 Tax=Kitasatospora sp. NBC_00070 TaxID=2975962 RepID=UPI003252F21B
MHEHPGTAALVQIMSPEFGSDEQVDWTAAEAAWSTRFPSDYRAFMSCYGGGTIAGEVDVLLPLPKEGIQWDPGSFEGETGNARSTWEMVGGQAGLDLDPVDILAWGVTSGADILCWLTTDPDPEQWPVLVCGRHTREDFTLHPCGMVEFLRRLLLDDFDVYPLSIDLRGHAPKFVHWREQQLRWKAGLDPDTGEPDPYADMFPR